MAIFQSRKSCNRAAWEECPDEILLEIISRLDRSEEIASLSSTCLRLCALVAPVLQDHKAFRHLDVLRSNYPTRLEGISFHSMLERPEVCRYVRRVKVDFCGVPSRWGPSDSREKEFLERAVEDVGIRAWDDGSTLVEALGDFCTQGITSKVDDGKTLVEVLHDCSPHVALFLLTSPNLEQLVLRHYRGYDWINWAIRKLFSGHPIATPASLVSRLGFHALREVALVNHYPWFTDLEHLKPFFLLPSIRKISAENVLQRPEFDWDGVYGKSTVTHLIFTHCVMGLYALEMLLRVPKALNYFRYLSGGIFYGWGKEVYADFDEDMILDVVRQTQSGLERANIDIQIVENVRKPRPINTLKVTRLRLTTAQKAQKAQRALDKAGKY